jgi:hypothetical protein
MNKLLPQQFKVSGVRQTNITSRIGMVADAVPEGNLLTKIQWITA